MKQKRVHSVMPLSGLLAVSGFVWIQSASAESGSVNAEALSIAWQESPGGEETSMLWSVGLADEGGYVVAGYSESFHEESRDIYVAKLGRTGGLEWETSHMRTRRAEAFHVRQTRDGGCIAAG